MPLPNIQSDDALYKAWKSAPAGYSKDMAFQALMIQLNGPIMTAVNTFRTAPLPLVTMELEAKRIGGQAVMDWSPTAGMNLAPYVGTIVRQRLYRYVAEHQNVGRLPEESIRQVGNIQRAITNLGESLGREPTTPELADHLGLPVSHVTRLRKSLRKDLLESGIDDELAETLKHDPNYERVMLAYYGLTDMEKQVFDFSMGAHGQPKLKPQEIAARLKVSPARISALKHTLGSKLSPMVRD
jgi:DNA-directed RNA polymerase sigma subunit (sigma70/sigma32)